MPAGTYHVKSLSAHDNDVFLETRYKCKCIQTCTYTHPYGCMHAHPTPMSTSERLSRGVLRLTVDGNAASHWKNIPHLWDTKASNLEFDPKSALLTIQPQVGSPWQWCWCSTGRLQFLLNFIVEKKYLHRQRLTFWGTTEETGQFAWL